MSPATREIAREIGRRLRVFKRLLDLEHNLDRLERDLHHHYHAVGQDFTADNKHSLSTGAPKISPPGFGVSPVMIKGRMPATLDKKGKSL